MSVYTHISVCVYICISVCVCIHALMCVCVCAYTLMCVCAYMHQCVYVCVCMCVCIHTFMYVCVCRGGGGGTFYQISPFTIRAGPHNAIKQNCCSQQTKMNMSLLDAMITGLMYGPVS